MPVVTVVIPCYNQGKYLDECIQSVIKQTYKDYEIIVVNDGSTDQFTIDMLASYSDSRITVIHTSNNGVALARNNGIRQASGRYILPLDADDRIGEEYLEAAVAVLDSNPEVGIVYCEAEKFGDVTGKWELPPFSLEEILLYNVIFNSALFRKVDWEEVGGYDFEMENIWEDYDFWLMLIERGAGVYKINKTLFYYRVSGTSSMTGSLSIDKKLEAYNKIFNKHYELYRDNMGYIFKKIMYLEDRFLTATIVYEDQIATLTGCINDVKNGYEEQITHLEDEKKEIHLGYQTVIDSIHADNSRLSEQLAYSINENSRLSTQYSNVCEECSSLKHNLLTLSEQNENLTQSIALLQSQIDQLQQILSFHQRSIAFNTKNLFHLILDRFYGLNRYIRTNFKELLHRFQRKP